MRRLTRSTAPRTRLLLFIYFRTHAKHEGHGRTTIIYAETRNRTRVVETVYYCVLLQPRKKNVSYVIFSW